MKPEEEEADDKKLVPAVERRSREKQTQEKMVPRRISGAFRLLCWLPILLSFYAFSDIMMAAPNVVDTSSPVQVILFVMQPSHAGDQSVSTL